MTLQGSVGSAEPWVRGGDRASHWFTVFTWPVGSVGPHRGPVVLWISPTPGCLMATPKHIVSRGSYLFHVILY